MKKIFQFITGTIKFVLGNLDYLAAFALGAFAYNTYPELLNDAWNYIANFDLNAAFEAVKAFGMKVYDYGMQAYDYIVAKFA